MVTNLSSSKKVVVAISQSKNIIAFSFKLTYKESCQLNKKQGVLKGDNTGMVL